VQLISNFRHHFQAFGREMLVKGSVEDFIYILIGIIWIAFSIYKGFKSSQKKKTEPTHYDETYEEEPESSSGDQAKKSVFDSFLEEIMSEKEPAPKPVEVEKKAEKTPTRYEDLAEKEPFSYDDFYEERNYIEPSDVYDDKGTATRPTKQTELVTHLQRRRKPRIDLRKAVIYSEILNRRYF
jgi:hypothetical protein